MLQRIQSIYLLFAALVIAALFVFPLVHDVYVDGQSVTIKVTGIYNSVNGQSTQLQAFTPLTIATVVVALIPIAIIFMYGDRKRQIMLCYGAMGVILAYSYWVSTTVKNAIGGANLEMSNYGIGIILLSLAIFLIVFAQKAIQKDEKLVRSADRLR
ncbi:DUF4293 domain-containing protein [Mucilaginibacter calamicampi]|uniref:DUF4293 domain-containing protein n=1 Tax=Mucilaginibacter calamicampi TaxID=1302352 RepID=A0ABW2YVF3_9SPHI